jgi:hypothetical protein
MDTKSKFISDEKEFFALIPIVKTFPLIHNKLKADFLSLLELTEIHRSETKYFQTLCRACIKNLFSVIGADIFYYNLFDKYEGYDDQHRFIDKFKMTFKQICKTWDREELQKEYFSTKLQSLKELRVLRNNLAHPKELKDVIDPTKEELAKIKKAFQEYDNFITTLMSNFFIETNLPYEKIKNAI